MHRNRWKTFFLVEVLFSAYVHAQEATACQMSEVVPSVPAPVSCRALTGGPFEPAFRPPNRNTMDLYRYHRIF